MIDFGLNPEGLAALGSRLAAQAETARSAQQEFDTANKQLAGLVKHPKLTTAFSQFGASWWRMSALVPSEAGGLGHAVVAAAAAGVAADEQSATDQSTAVSSSTVSHSLICKSINAQ